MSLKNKSKSNKLIPNLNNKFNDITNKKNLNDIITSFKLENNDLKIKYNELRIKYDSLLTNSNNQLKENNLNEKLEEYSNTILSLNEALTAAKREIIKLVLNPSSIFLLSSSLSDSIFTELAMEKRHVRASKFALPIKCYFFFGNIQYESIVHNFININ